MHSASPNPFEKFRKRDSTCRSESQDEEETGKTQIKKARQDVGKIDQHLEPSSVQGGLPEKLGDSPLRLIIVGHNPSDHAWKTGHYYSNPGNWILISTGIAPDGVSSAEDDDLMPAKASIGFTDVGTGIPGTDSSQFASSVLETWSLGFIDRLVQHLRRANTTIGCQCGKCGAPRFVVFAGKRQWIEVYNSGRKGKQRIKTVSVGKQTAFPLNWPFPETTEVWVLPSTSGASALTLSQRQEPYMLLSERLQEYPWPDKRPVRCKESEKP